MIIRRVGPSAAAQWRVIRLEALALAPEAFAPGEDAFANWPLEAYAADIAARAVLLALAGGEPAGCIVWTRDDDPAWSRRRGWIAGLYVTPRSRGLGLGGRLIAAALDDAAAAGLGALCLEVAPANRAAIAAYARAGFREVAAGCATGGGGAGAGTAGAMAMRRGLLGLRILGIFTRRNRKLAPLSGDDPG